MVGIAKFSRVVSLEKGNGMETAGFTYIQEAGPSFRSYVLDKLFPERKIWGFISIPL